jgi:hypothetical protein
VPVLQLLPAILKYLLQRDTQDDDQYGWGPMQITAPIVVGVVLIVAFTAFIIWYKRSPHNSPIAHHYSRVRDACVSRFTRFFMPGRRRRRRVQHVSTPITLDDSMVTPRQMRRPHHSYSSDSTDSQTPLTDTVEFYYPPQKYADPSGRPMFGAPQQSERRTWRWWRFFGLGPHKVTSQVPSHRFQIEGPDESSVGHGDGDGSLGSPIAAVGSGWTSGLPALCEQDEGDPQRGFYDRVIQIGDPQVTIHSTPRTPAHYEDVAVAAPPGSVPSSAKTPAPEYRSTAEFPYTTSNLRNTTTVPTTVIPQISYHTTVSPDIGSTYVCSR